MPADTMTVVLSNLPPFFDDVALEMLLQPTEDASGSQVLLGSLWGQTNGVPMVMAHVPREVGIRMLDVNPMETLAGEREVKEGRRRNFETAAVARARRNWRGQYVPFGDPWDMTCSLGSTTTAAKEAEDEQPEEDEDDVPLDVLMERKTPQKKPAGRGRRTAASLAAVDQCTTHIVVTESPIDFKDVDWFSGGAQSKGWAASQRDAHAEQQRRRKNEYVPFKKFDDDDEMLPEKRSRQEGAEGEKPAAPEATPWGPQTPKAETQARPSARMSENTTFSKDQCKKCGSTDHLSRHCTGGSAAKPAAPVAEATPKAETQARPSARMSEGTTFSKDQCKKCGSTDHLSRHCPGTSATKPVAAPVVEATPKAETTYARPSARMSEGTTFSKDQCKKCGSTDHLSRHCTGSAVKPPAPAPVPEPAPWGSSSPKAEPKPPKPTPPANTNYSKDQCKHCGSGDHLSRHCPSK